MVCVNSWAGWRLLPSKAAAIRTGVDHQSTAEGTLPVSTCENHGEGKHGKICSFYITVVLHGVKHGRRLRLCSACIDSMRDTFGDQWSDGFVLTKNPQHPTCVGCGELAPMQERLQPLYATGYSKNDLRHDYSAYYCDSCARSVISQFKLEEARNGSG